MSSSPENTEGDEGTQQSATDMCVQSPHAAVTDTHSLSAETHTLCQQRHTLCQRRHQTPQQAAEKEKCLHVWSYHYGNAKSDNRDVKTALDCAVKLTISIIFKMLYSSKVKYYQIKNILILMCLYWAMRYKEVFVYSCTHIPRIKLNIVIFYRKTCSIWLFRNIIGQWRNVTGTCTQVLYLKNWGSLLYLSIFTLCYFIFVLHSMYVTCWVTYFAYLDY